MVLDLAAAERVIDGAASQVPGLAVGIVSADRDPVFFCRGMADVRSGRPVSTDTVFKIGSISKTYTALAFARLVERGLVNLDDPVEPLLGDVLIGEWVAQITYEHLLTHTAGLGDLRRLSDLWGVVLSLGVVPGKAVPPLEDYYAVGVEQPRHPSRWCYANHGFGLLGLAIERLTGEPFELHIRELFYDLGLRRADFARTPDSSAGLAVGYRGRPGSWKALPDFDVAIPSAGSIFSDVTDQARYVQALLHYGLGAVRPDTFADMIRPRFQLDDALPGMGLGFMTQRIADIETIQHGGGWVGFTSMMIAAPDEGVGVIAFSNSGSLTPVWVADEALRATLGRPSGADEYARHSGRTAPQFSDFVGVYSPDRAAANVNLRELGAGWEIEVVRHRDGLAVRRLWGELRRPIPIVATATRDVFGLQTRAGLTYLRFGRDDTGQINDLNLGFSTLNKRRRPSLRWWSSAAMLATGAATAGVLLRRRRQPG